MDTAGGWQWLAMEVLHCSNNLVTGHKHYPPGNFICEFVPEPT